MYQKVVRLIFHFLAIYSMNCMKSGTDKDTTVIWPGFWKTMFPIKRRWNQFSQRFFRFLPFSLEPNIEIIDFSSKHFKPIFCKKFWSQYLAESGHSVLRLHFLDVFRNCWELKSCRNGLNLSSLTWTETEDDSWEVTSILKFFNI